MAYTVLLAFRFMHVKSPCRGLVAAALPILLNIAAFNLYAATTDAWISDSSGLWQTAASWSSNTAPNATFGLIAITNNGSKTVTIDSTTPTANLSVQKLTIGAPSGSVNSLQIADATPGNPLQLSGALTINSGGLVDIANSSLIINGFSGGILNIAGGDLRLQSGLFDSSTTTAGKISASSRGGGTVTVNGGSMQVAQLQIGATAGLSGSLTISNGVFRASSLLSLGQTFNATGIVSVAGGSFIATNDLTRVGNLGAGRIDITGGSAQFAFLSMGENSGASGTVNVTGGELRLVPRTTNDFLRVGSIGLGQLTINSGTHIIGAEFHLADDISSTGLVWITSAKVFATNDLTAIGRYGIGQMVVSNAFVQLTNASIGRHQGAVGTLVVQTNGVVTQLDDLSIGRFAGATGHVIVDGGALAMTNDNLWIGREGTGDLSVNSGLVSAKSLFIGMSPDGSNAPSGTLMIAGGTTVLSSNLVVGTSQISTGTVLLSGGTLLLSGQAVPAQMRVDNGTFTVSGGELSGDNLLLTNSSGQFVLNSGTLHLKSASISNGVPFVVGDSVNPATLDLGGGTFSFADGLVISQNATLTGCGTILGTIVNHGTISTNCGGAQDITIAVGASPAEGGTVTGGGVYPVETPVTLSATANSGFLFLNWTENGAVVAASSVFSFSATTNRTLVATFVRTFTISTSSSNNAVSFAFLSTPGVTYVLEYKDDLTAPDWTPQLPGSPGTGDIITLIEPVAAVPMRFYRVRAQ